jgi:hypothetical protein
VNLCWKGLNCCHQNQCPGRCQNRCCHPGMFHKDLAQPTE